MDKYIELRVRDDKIFLGFVHYGLNSKRFTVPSGVEVLGDGCMSGLDFQVVRLAHTVIDVRSNCFANCNKLKTIEIYKQQRKFIPLLKQSNRAEIVIIE
ncbi:MAG: leucine-rich repeat domain-containing protein [Oscillospiraceae bacterium]|nr:leucine-rich repeat domain-containing protein [Oscillospiraceae bacterium]